MTFSGLSVIATGMVCSLGNTSTLVSAAVKAGISRYQISNTLNRRNNPIVMAQVPEDALAPLPDDFALLQQQQPGQTFLLRLAAAALNDCLPNGTGDHAIPVFLACPETLPGTQPRLRSDFLQQLNQLSDCQLDLANSRSIYTGRAGGFQALDVAFEYFKATTGEFALIGGVDGLRFFDNALERLDKEKRLLAENTAEGHALGEGAGFVLLASAQAIQKYQLQSQLWLGKPGLALEEGHRYSDLPYRGDGLSQAFRQALAAAPGLPIHNVYTSLNGESFAAKELGVARIRHQQRLHEQVPVHHPAEYFGDIGAAMAPFLISLAAHNDTQPSLIYCSSDGPTRGAVCSWPPSFHPN